MIDVITGFEAVHLVAFILAGLLLNITPGADFIFISASGISGGPKVGFAAAVGVLLGVTVHVVAAAAGVSAILLAYPATYDAIRFAGAAYLLYLAWMAWLSSGIQGEARPALSINSAIKRGFVTNVLNPKTALFIFAFIPQFTDPHIGPMWMQILFLGAIFQFFGFLFAISLGVAAGVFANALRSRVGLLNKVTAIMFGGLAARLILD